MTASLRGAPRAPRRSPFASLPARPAGALRVAALAAACVALAGCEAKKPPPPPAPPVATVAVAPARVVLTEDYPATLEASNTVEIRPRVGGVLERQVAVEGQRVRKGDLLFVIDPAPFEAALSQAKAALAQAEATRAQAERELARAEPLSTIDALSQRELDAAVAQDRASRAQVQAAQAGVDTAQLNLSYTQVRSPIDGIVGRALLRLGAVVTAYSTLLTTVYQPDPMYVNFSLGEQRLLALQKELGRAPDDRNKSNRDFRLRLGDGTEYPMPARLNFLDAAVDPRTDTLAIRLAVANPQGLLRAGQYARVVVSTQPLEDAILVPQRAVQQLQDKYFVWVVDRDGKAQPHDVQLGQRVGTDWYVQQGLAAGDKVIVDGIQRLRPGVTVSATPSVAMATSGPAAAPAPAGPGR
jgi:membrane fusion protein (multidrug efflux system)